MQNDVADFHGLTFEADFYLFASEFEEIPAVYVIYTAKSCLEVGESSNLKYDLEVHPNTKQWVNLANGEDIYVAIHFEESKEERKDKQMHLRSKMNPQIK